MQSKRAQDAAGRLIAGLFVVISVLCLVPVVMMLAGGLWHFHTLCENVNRLLSLLGNSTIVALTALFVSLLLGTSAGFLCFRTNCPGRRILVFASIVAASVPLYITTACWIAIFGMTFWLSNTVGAGFLHGVAYTPLVILITGICFSMADPELEEQASLDAGRGRVFCKVSLPAGAWGIGAAGLVVIVLSLTDMTVTDILAVRSFAEEVYSQFQFSSDPWRAAAVALPVVLQITVLLVGLRWLIRHYGSATVAGTLRVPQVVVLNRSGRFIASLFLLCLILGYLVPFIFLCRKVDHLSNLITTFSVASPELFNTVALAAIAAVITALLASAWAWSYVRGHLRGWVSAGLIALIALPAPLVGIGLIKLLNWPGFLQGIYDSQVVVIIAYVIRILPFAVLAAIPAMQRIPREIEDAAVLDGSGWPRRMISIILPMSWRGMMMAWFVSFILALGELGASFLVVPPGRTTLSVRFFTLIHYGLYPDVAGICLILTGCVLLPGIVIATLLWRGMSRRYI